MKKIRGFTLVELLMTIVIGAILLTIAIPSFQPFIRNSRITTATNELVSALHLARNEAIRTRSVGCVCSSATVETAAPTCDAGNNWESGWLVFVDTGGNCNFTNGTDVLIKAQDGDELGTEITIRNKDASITAVNYVRFNSRGAPQRPNGAIQQGVFSICDGRGLQATANNESVARAVQLNAAGGIRSSKKIPVIASCP